MTNITNEIKLKVVEALQDDAYKGIARIDLDAMRRLGLRRGDVIVISGKRDTTAIVDRSYPADIGEPIIRIDGIIRKNAKAGIGELISIKKAELKEAKKITIAPAQKGIVVQGEPEMIKQSLLGRAVIKGDIVVLGGVQRRRDVMSDFMSDSGFGDIFSDLNDVMGFGFGQMQQLRFLIVNTTPLQPCIITENTELVLNSKAVDMSEEKVPVVTYEDVGGLTDEVKKIREMVELPLKHPEIFERLGIDPPRGVILYGPPGTGKTLLAKAVANESGVNFILINGPEIFNKFYGESEKNIRDTFEQAEKNAPSIVFIDELDAIAPSRDSNLGSGEVEKRVVSQLLTMLDGLKSRGKVIVIGATNRPDSIDSALRRPGRFDREIEINVPNKEGRLAILKIHTRNMPLAKDVDLVHIASITCGFVGADLSALVKEAAMSVLRKVLPKLKFKDGEKEEISPEILSGLRVTKDDFDDALKFVQPSALREIAVEVPSVNWVDVGGLGKVKQELIEAVEWPLKNPSAFKRMGIRAPRGILLYGPPGTGKTMLAKAIAKESESNFIQIDGPELQKEGIVGKETERLRKIFKRAKQVAPAVVFIDEIDSFARRRGVGSSALSESNESLLNTLLTEMDGLEELKEIVVIGATNRPDMLDPAILRPGRFDRLILTIPPNKEGRLEIFKIHTRNMPLAKDVNLGKLAEITEGYVGADIESVCREAGMIALRSNINSEIVTEKNFEEAMKKVSASIPKETMEKYLRVEEEYLKSAKAAIAPPVPIAYFG